MKIVFILTALSAFSFSQQGLAQNFGIGELAPLPPDRPITVSTMNTQSQTFVIDTYTHKKCESSEGAHVVLPLDLKTKKVIPACAPEVLYMWKNDSDVTRYLGTDSQYLPSRGPLWGWRTPLGTFAYGTQLIRMKLKPETQFYWHKSWEKDGGCSHLTSEQQKNTVVFGYYGGKNFSEYVICSPEVVESWSYQTTEIYNEVMAEYYWIKNNYQDFTQFDRFYKTISTQNFTDQDYSATNFLHFKVDNQDWTEFALLNKLTNLKRKLDAGSRGGITYAPGVSPDPERHNRVEYPDYFNALQRSDLNSQSFN